MKRLAFDSAYHRRALAAGCFSVGALNLWAALLKLEPGRHSPIKEALGASAGAAPRFLMMLAGLLLFTSIPGLLRAKRMSWAAALAAAVLSFTLRPLSPRDLDSLGGILSAGLALALVVAFSAFPARSDRRYIRRGLTWLVGGQLFVFLLGTVGLYVLDREFVEPIDAREAFTNAVRLLFILPATSIEPSTRHGWYFIDAVRALSLTVLGVSLWHFAHPVLHNALVRPGDLARVRALLAEYGTNALAQFHLLDDKSYRFSDDGLAFLSFRMVGTTAVVLGEPVGDGESCAALARAFAAECQLNGWRLAFHQVTEVGAARLTELGFKALKVGEEAVIPVRSFSTSGKSFKHLRHEKNSLERDGYVVEELSQPLDDETVDELREVSDAWMTEGGHRERGFTLGRFDPSYLRSTRVFAVRRPGARIEAFANVLPPYQATAGTFDLMRRRPDSPNGVMDLLMLYFIELFRDEGLEGVNLGLAPLSNIDAGGPVPTALRLIYERGNAAFNFRGLREFKAKWAPRWESRFLVYTSEADLLPVAVAVAKAGEEGGLWTPLVVRALSTAWRPFPHLH
ncbi:MAG: phosphatidylglycerol lysyltransferase domain-containing protein [Dehalococcoidia bacterium]|nr:DUF2156 domain-containing protein [Dehalococcoidia bacterium]MCA9831568.1 DUF2156 domain-containing protein [Dehalococcoidia bacterium]MCB9486939.1 DUF2156 domain-containing protein [Thermoflexaceae bacterium]